MRVLVTGANGYIGSHVVASLLRRPDTEVVAVGLGIQDMGPGVECLDMNILAPELDAFNATGRPDACIHLAWRDGFIHNSPAHIADLSLHFRLCHGLLEGGLETLAVMGTMHEVGYHVGAIDEDTPCNPVSMYGIAKDTLRRSLLLLTQDQPERLRWLRGYYIVGDDARNHSVFAKLLQAAAAGQKSFPFNSGKNKYDFISVGELAEQIVASTLQQEVFGIINCCSGQPQSLGAKVEAFIEQNGLEIELEYGAFPDRPYDSPEVWGDATKIHRIMKNK